MSIDLENFKFMECPSCNLMPVTPLLCPSCHHNRAVIEVLRAIARVHFQECMIPPISKEVHHIISFGNYGSGIILTQEFLKKIDEKVREEVQEYLKRWFGLVKEG